MTSTYHLDCLRQAMPDPGPGTLVFALRRPLRLKAGGGDAITLPAGEPLHVERAGCVRDALTRHLQRPSASSVFRQGIAMLLGLDGPGGEAGFDAAVERAVDTYSQAVTVLRIEGDAPGAPGVPQDGVFDRMAPGLVMRLASQEG